MALSRWSRQEKVFSLYERTSVSLITFPVNDREGGIVPAAKKRLRIKKHSPVMTDERLFFHIKRKLFVKNIAISMF
ncbi:hypothetical protein ATZ36_12140 [Candidatus Endomicrobiellum trichonymphae]|uniref:Uncharacterized protein n=1 Tax=Endomicrobium trichonymphae TaxID=1408204 RepID=A0A1E5IN02_ENDTX|nr:hypothetical protein ATZ36_12140 [Candidatus Endomicrobium trichonymphae]